MNKVTVPCKEQRNPKLRELQYGDLFRYVGGDHIYMLTDGATATFNQSQTIKLNDGKVFNVNIDKEVVRISSVTLEKIND